MPLSRSDWPSTCAPISLPIYFDGNELRFVIAAESRKEVVPRLAWNFCCCAHSFPLSVLRVRAICVPGTRQPLFVWSALRACTAKVSAMVISVATGSRISLNQLFALSRELIGSDVNASYASPRAGDVRDSQADITRARQLLGYEPTVSFADGLRKPVDWYRTEAATVPQK
jgi:hypothetical protein